MIPGADPRELLSEARRSKSSGALDAFVQHGQGGGNFPNQNLNALKEPIRFAEPKYERAFNKFLKDGKRFNTSAENKVDSPQSTE